MSRSRAERFDPLVWKRQNGFQEWAALTAICLCMRPRWPVSKCEQVLQRIDASTDGPVHADIARDLLHWLWARRRYALLLRACDVLQTRDLGAAWGLPDAYREAVAQGTGLMISRGADSRARSS